MKKTTLFVGFAAAGLMAGSSAALAGGDKTQPSSSQTSSQPGSSQPAAPASQGSQLSGKILSVDQQSKLVTISSDTGKSQDVKVGDSTNIMRDGSSVSFSQLKPGDQVRASLDPSTHQATTLEVQSKAKQ